MGLDVILHISSQIRTPMDRPYRPYADHELFAPVKSVPYVLDITPLALLR